ncbi:MAG: PhoX family protein [Pseudanabaenales cyanobacterium]|nr:PhoX family protein [Pseudanabaenales cyanobacterium]
MLDLPAGFQYRTLSQAGDRMSDGNPLPGAQD